MQQRNANLVPLFTPSPQTALVIHAKEEVLSREPDASYKSPMPRKCPTYPLVILVRSCYVCRARESRVVVTYISIPETDGVSRPEGDFGGGRTIGCLGISISRSRYVYGSHKKSLRIDSVDDTANASLGNRRRRCTRSPNCCCSSP